MIGQSELRRPDDLGDTDKFFEWRKKMNEFEVQSTKEAESDGMY